MMTPQEQARVFRLLTLARTGADDALAAFAEGLAHMENVQSAPKLSLATSNGAAEPSKAEVAQALAMEAQAKFAEAMNRLMGSVAQLAQGPKGVPPSEAPFG